MNPDLPNDVPLLQVRDVALTYARRRGIFGSPDQSLAAVDGVSLSIQPGEVFGLAGESGSGKSSLARLLVQLAKPERGEVLLAGIPIAQAADARRRVQIVFQDPSAALSPRRSIRQTLLEPLQHFRMGPSREHADRVAAALQAVGLDAAALERRPHQFSSGQKQRLCIARALLAEPELLIADEAVSALDVSVQAQILDLIRRLSEERGIAVLFISHDLAVIGQIADRTGIMLAGRLVEQAPGRAMFRAPAHPYTRHLLAAVTDPDPAKPRPAAAPLATLTAAERAAGCPFRPRCDARLPACEHQAPGGRLAGTGPGHVVECHLYPEDPEPARADE